MTYQPFYTIPAPSPSRWLLTCDHASNTVPPFVGGGELGLPMSDMARHIAYDVGAAGVTRRLAEALGASAVLSNFSRLVIDPNRGEDDPTVLMRLSDGSIIPANRHADAAEKERRLERCHRPYHRAIAETAAAIEDPVLVSVHSFTPQLRGRPHRPWQIGLLFAEDTRLARPVLDILRTDPEIAEAVRQESGAPLCVGVNEPYSGYLPGDAIDRHATATGRLNLLIELRNDLIEHEDGQRAWAHRLASVLDRALPRAMMTEQEEMQNG
ncbi:N-formylglutamate amidohydrolase [Poseidonocella sedimentorum]|uniref:Predicted N-formylglutamate amidohydrolase n=1 Tax=Poseidonocella sedimentorum TaxID=871652 RepID=A0A1I6DUW6_9RHOB|nr:N-formylglutamate amidohydrolase [Poseidonocella sedimentorum]SFR09157.1 Predicted N-formylglutamate amidohydrolase [Poseidonocella sedimentorum]